MPEFVLNTDGAGAPWKSLDAFTQGFIEAAFFCETSCIPAAKFFTKKSQRLIEEGQSDGNIPQDASVSDIDEKSFIAAVNFCDKFQTENATLLTDAYERDYDETQAGRDLYYTYAGHGVGYWDRDELKTIDNEEYERLTDIMRNPTSSTDQWNAASKARNEIDESSIGKRLTKACGRGEINLWAYQDKRAHNGFFVEFYIG